LSIQTDNSWVTVLKSAFYSLKRLFFNENKQTMTIHFHKLKSILLATTLCTTALNAQDITTGRVACYLFNGNANDASVTANHGTVNGALPTTNRFGVPNSAYSFNGTTDNIDIPHNAVLSPTNISIAVWVRPTVNRQMAILGKSVSATSANEQYGMFIYTANPYYFLIRNSTNCGAGTGWTSLTSQPADPTLNSWNLIVATLSGGVMKYYLNGVEQPGNSTAGFIGNCVGGSLHLGTWWSGDPNPYQGDMDDLCIYNRALTQADVTALYDCTTAPTIARTVQPTCAVPTGSITVTAQTDVQYSFDGGITYQASNTQSGLAAGTYNVKVKNLFGCESAATSVTLNALPTGGTITLSCPLNSTVTAAAGQSSAIVTYSSPNGVTSCSVSGVTVTPAATNIASGGTFPLGPTTLNFTITDACCNTKPCSFTITVTPTGVLTPNCPADVIATAAEGQASATVNYTAPISTSTCPVGSVSVVAAATNTPSGGVFPIGTTPLNYTITDGCGNTKTCTFNIIVKPSPNEVLTVTCPNNLTVNTLPGQITRVISYLPPSAITTCPIGTLTVTPAATNQASGTAFPAGTTTLTFTITDGCGNTKTCVTTVKVVATGVLTVNCPADIAVTAASGQLTALVTYSAPTATSTCGLPAVVVTPDPTNRASGTAFPVGVTTLRFTITDGCGNSKTCLLKVTVKPVGVLTFACPSNVVTMATKPAGIPYTYSPPTATSTCPVPPTKVTGAATNPVSGAIFPVGVTTLTFTATDGCGNTQTCSYTVTVKPTPTAVTFVKCPLNASFSVAGPSKVIYDIPTATTTCPGGKVTVKPAGTNLASNSIFPIGTTTLSFTATDECGNTATCTFTVTLVKHRAKNGSSGDNNLLLYPNPIENELNIDLFEANRNYKVQIFDLLGKIIFEQATDAQSPMKINTTHWQSGVYIIRTSDGETIMESKILRK
jgi:Concanavalin A-like lectin/glucanases superfamily/Secretion system C-terminal sorting domain/HYR domain